MLPVETISAVFPPSAELHGVRYAAGLFPVRVAIRLRPMTLLHAVAMETLGVSLDMAEIPPHMAFAAAWVMTMDPAEARMTVERDRTEDFNRWAATVVETLDEVSRKVNSAINIAFSTCVPGKSPERPTITNTPGPRGYGWPLEVAESLAAEYGMSVDAALETPVVRAFALIACARIRNGGEAGGPDYYERIVCRNVHERKERERREREIQAEVEEEEECGDGE